MGRRVLGYSLAVFAVLLPANVLFVMLRRPDVTETAKAIRQHNWRHAQCEDMTDNCAAWTKRGMCRWDRTTQRLCRSSCDRCDVGAHESIHSVPLSLSLPAYTAVAKKMELKVATALASPALAKALDQVARLNKARLQDAKIDPRTCQRSEVHNRGQALMHDFLGSLSRAASVQDACRFDMLPVLPRGQCIDEAPDCPATDEVCRGPAAVKMVQQCRKSCSFCSGGCEDTDKQRCAAWAKDGQCTSNMAFMLESCAASCGTCRQLHDPKPPHFVVLWNGLLMPSIGFGTAGLGEEAHAAVSLALKSGYRHIDSAQAPEWYCEDLNAQALRDSGVPREEVFITSKVHPRHFGFNATLAAVASTLKTFGTEYIDLMLLHYPGCWGSLCGDTKPEGTWRESWRALEQLVKDGSVLSIGVSNFGIPELVELLSWAIVPPAVVQRNSDVFSQDKVMHRLCLSLGIRYEAYSSLGTQYLSRGYTSSPVLSHPAVQAIAAEHGSSAAQVVLSYALTMGQIVLPRSRQQAHMQEALQSPQTRLSYDELLLLANLDHHLPAS